jgi:serine/threonine protein kinase
MALASGTKLGPYEIQSPLGAGGMGEVYRARDTRLERTVAIKVLPYHLSSDPDLKQRFEREARAISSLNHPRICTLHDVGHQDGVDFLVMEHLDGETLADRLKKGPTALKESLKIGIEVCEALEAAQRAGIVHRDLKPGNIMLTKNGAKLMDFGLAKAAITGLGSRDSSAPLLSAARTMSGATPLSPLSRSRARRRIRDRICLPWAQYFMKSPPVNGRLMARASSAWRRRFWKTTLSRSACSSR